MKKTVFIVSLLLLPLVSSANFDISLKYGSRGDAVVELQDFLQNQKDYTGNLDGRFGFQTLNAVKQFQLENNLNVDGYFGKMSRAKANDLLTVILAPSNTTEQTETGTVSNSVIQSLLTPINPQPVNTSIPSPIPVSNQSPTLAVPTIVYSLEVNPKHLTTLADKSIEVTLQVYSGSVSLDDYRVSGGEAPLPLIDSVSVLDHQTQQTTELDTFVHAGVFTPPYATFEYESSTPGDYVFTVSSHNVPKDFTIHVQ